MSRAPRRTHWGSRNDDSGRVLVLDGEYVPALSVVRSLGRRGLGVEVGGDSSAPLAGYSRYALRVHRYPDPLEDPAGFVSWVGTEACSGRFALVVPVTEKTLVPLVLNAGAMASPAAPVALPPAGALEIALSKAATAETARSLGVPVPKTLCAASLDETVHAAEAIGYPVVIKPVRSVGQDAGSRRVQLAVTYARDVRELRSRAQALLPFGELVLQERFAGQGAGIELIAEHGRMAYAFQHLRLHELPLSGGGSSLRRSTPLDPELLEASARLVQALGWHGVAMIEFKRNPETGEFRLMEINGRLWGSLPLAVACGADFPSMMYDLYTTGRISPPPPARTGIVCRKLSDDLYWYELVLRRIDPSGLIRFPPGHRILKDALLCLSPRHRFDVQELRDPKPGLVDIRRIGARYAQRLSEQWRDRSLRRHHSARWREGGVARSLGSAGSVLFVCHGNINRSVLAQRALEQRLQGHPIEVLSAGFHGEAERPADPVMTEVAGRAGIDLSGWRSKTLDRQMLSRSDIVFVMETAHLKRLREQFPDVLDKCYMLGFADGRRAPGGEIADPYGKPVGEYEECFRRVVASIDVVAAMIRQGGRQ